MLPDTSDDEIIENLLHRYGNPEVVFQRVKEVAGSRVGRPPDARRKCTRVLCEIVDYHSLRHPGGRLNQYRLMALAKDRLQSQGVKVGTSLDADKDLDMTSLRDASRRVLLFYCEENIENYTMNDWKWLMRKLSKAGRVKLKADCDCFIQHYQEAQKYIETNLRLKKVVHSLEQIAATDETDIDELHEAEGKRKYWQEVRNLFKSKAL